MTSKDTTNIFSGRSNQGLQLGSNFGHVYFNIHGQLENTQQERRLEKLSNDTQVLDARDDDHRQRTSLLLNRLEESNRGIQKSRDKLEEIHFSEEESRCFETLRTSNYLARKDLNPERLPGTCKWFLDHPKYQGWLTQTSASRLLWVSGDPGCGKSVLAKALVDRYDRRSVCYYFFKDDTIITRSAAHAICAILHQICDLRPVLIRYVLPMYRRNGAKLVNLFEDLWSAFVDIINDKDFGNVICILDAIDECLDDDYKKLLPRLAAIANLSTCSVKILITSRPYTMIETALFHKTGLDKNEIRLSGEAMAEQSIIEKEVGIFITSRVQEFQKLRESNDIYDNVHEKLQSHLNGVKNRTYLWVSAVFNELEKDVDAPEYILMETAEGLPENVHKAYENILEKSRKKPLLKKALHVMLAAFRPLSVMEMNVVLSMQETSSGPRYSGLYPENSFYKWLRNLCGFFVNIVDDELYFTHQTVREFLVEEIGYQTTVGSWRGSFQLADSHTLIARICIDYLLMLYDGLMNATFEAYATYNWPAHCQRLEVDQSLADKVQGFMFQDRRAAPSFVQWTTRSYGIKHGRDWNLHSWKIGSSETPLFLACNYGWSSVISVLKFYPDIDWNQTTRFGQTGLHIAAQEGHLKVMKLLLNAGTDVNNQTRSKETAFSLAVSKGYLEIVKLLLNSGADVNIKRRYKGTALHSAVLQGNVEIIKLLLMAGADVNIQDIRNETALHLAVSRKYIEIVKLFLTTRADVNIQNINRETPLHLAVSKGHLEITKLLLTEDADINIQDDEKRVALHRAAFHEHPDIVKLLLTTGADVNLQTQFKETALHLAVFRGRLNIVRILLTAGADVNIQSFHGTELHMAVSDGNLEIVKLLLTVGADINIQSYRGTALHMAVSRGSLEIMKLLLTAGADVNLQTRSGQTALHLAVSDGSLEIVKLLLTAGADVNIKSCRGTALHLAVSEGHLEIVKLLLTAGADVNLQTRIRHTALHFAVSRKSLDTVELLMTAGANVNLQTRSGHTALQLAVSHGSLEIVELLLTEGADINIQDYEKRAALHLAVSGGSLEIVKLLLSAGADINIQSRRGTALHMAKERNHVEIVEMLLAEGAIDI